MFSAMPLEPEYRDEETGFHIVRMAQYATVVAEEMGLMQMAETIALTHHERWDGSGYPCGLKGTAIPIEGRITALADVFDALTSKRVYKPACSVEAALAIIESESGAHFDPAVVEAFLARLDDVLEIQAQFSGVTLTEPLPSPACHPGRPG